ncbi:MAG: hypothetical protein RR315_04840 [Oscillospiraceae bacterium]
MYAVPVDAALRAPDGALLENGKAFISERGNFIDFKNDFVPLLKLGDPVTICLMLNDREAVRFDGNAYISSNTLLRISNVDGNLVEYARDMFGSNLFVRTILSFCHENRFKLNKGAQNIAATIYSITPDTLRFISLEKVLIGQELLINFKEPFPFTDVRAVVEKQWQLGVMAIGYQCYITYLPDGAADSISRYLSPFKTEVNNLRHLYGEAPRDSFKAFDEFARQL